MDASFAPQYIFLLKSICIVPRIAWHGRIFSMFLTENYIASRKETVAEPPGTLPRAQEPLRSQSEARNRNDSLACCQVWRLWSQ